MTTSPKKSWLFAVSGGPDSMATLHMNLDKVNCVCHVNYNTRKTSLDDQKLVERFCAEHQLPFFALSVAYSSNEGNFQNWARQKRYEFFVSMALKQGCDTIVTGHTADDFLETALMQSARGGFRLFFGIRQNSSFAGITVYRPSLAYTKRELLDYLKKNGVDYALDHTNSLPDYERNRVRLDLQKTDLEQKKQLFASYYALNEKFAQLRQRTERVFAEWKATNYSTRQFGRIVPQDLRVYVLYAFLEELNVSDRSAGKIDLLSNFIAKGKGNSHIRLGGGMRVLKKDALLFLEKTDPL